MTTQSILYGTYTTLTTTHLQSLSNSATAGWQSAVIDNRTNLAVDYEIFVSLPMANTAPASPYTAYVYAAPAVYTGSAWLIGDQGTTTLPTGSEGTTTIASTNNLSSLGELAYGTQNMTMQNWFTLSNGLGNTIPEGVVIIIINNTGAATQSSGCVVAYRQINYTFA